VKKKPYADKINSCDGDLVKAIVEIIASNADFG
jgi:hypothetical protein